jgi:prepilin-type processing-associated H-X9-DG protein
MDENLIGYLLKCLDTDEQHNVERYLREHPEAQTRLEKLRRGLDLLALDGGDAEPPAGLWVRTLAHVVEHKCRTLPAVPPPVARPAAAGRISWWRRADVLVAASLLILLSGIGVIGLAALRDKSHVVECENNLHKIYQGLTAYAEKRDDGRFPWVDSQPPKNFAGSFIAALNEEGVLPSDVSVSCPGSAPRAPAPVTFAQLGEMFRDRPDEYRETTQSLAGCYAYSLGYREAEAGLHQGLTQKMDGRLPIMSDIPPGRAANEVVSGNSPNHAGKGQNLLFVDGHVEFKTTRNLGVDDDIFRNAQGRVAAGRGLHDTVLGRSDAVPYPGLDE